MKSAVSLRTLLWHVLPVLHRHLFPLVVKQHNTLRTISLLLLLLLVLLLLRRLSGVSLHLSLLLVTLAKSQVWASPLDVHSLFSNSQVGPSSHFRITSSSSLVLVLCFVSVDGLASFTWCDCGGDRDKDSLSSSVEVECIRVNGSFNASCPPMAPTRSFTLT